MVESDGVAPPAQVPPTLLPMPPVDCAGCGQVGLAWGRLGLLFLIGRRSSSLFPVPGTCGP